MKLTPLAVWDFTGGSVVKNLPTKARATGKSSSIPGLGRSPREGILQYSCMRDPMDRRAWQSTVRGVTKS